MTPFSSRHPIRLSDLDWGRVMYFARYFDFAHRTFEDFFNAQQNLTYATLLNERALGFPVVHSEAEFLGPYRLGDTARVEMEVTRLSKRSVTSRFTFYRGETNERCAVITLKQAVVKTMDKGAAGVEMPDDIHALLA